MLLLSISTPSSAFLAVLARLDALVVVVDGDGEHLLDALLAHDDIRRAAP
jgi:hypothetical protein